MTVLSRILSVSPNPNLVLSCLHCGREEIFTFSALVVYKSSNVGIFRVRTEYSASTWWWMVAHLLRLDLPSHVLPSPTTHRLQRTHTRMARKNPYPHRANITQYISWLNVRIDVLVVLQLSSQTDKLTSSSKWTKYACDAQGLAWYDVSRWWREREESYECQFMLSEVRKWSETAAAGQTINRRVRRTDIDSLASEQKLFTFIFARQTMNVRKLNDNIVQWKFELEKNRTSHAKRQLTRTMLRNGHWWRQMNKWESESWRKIGDVFMRCFVWNSITS